MSIKVLLVDDHAVVLEGLRQLLDCQDDMQVVATASNGRQALELARAEPPDVVVMDITMTGLNGVDTTRQLLREHQAIRVLALSMHANREYVQSMLRAGAAGYALKNDPLDQLLQAIRAIAEGGSYYSAQVQAFIPGEGSENCQEATSAMGTLSSREREVLQLVVEGKSTKEVAALLFVTTKTVDWHRRSIMQKLGLRTVAELTKFAILAGLTPLDC